MKYMFFIFQMEEGNFFLKRDIVAALLLAALVSILKLRLKSMFYKAEFKGWAALSFDDMLVAYRKAKADCYLENGFPSSIAFAEFEDDLVENLKEILNKWQANKGPKVAECIGNFHLVPKKLTILPKDSANGHVHFSDKKKAFQYLIEKNHLLPELRIVGDFPVEAHIFSALWINMVGHKLDSCLEDKDVYGARLKREGGGEECHGDINPFHISAIGSFKPYQYPYQKWRNDGLNAIRSEIENNRPVVAVSLDLKSYYHNINPGFIGKKSFLETIGLSGTKSLSDEEIKLTQKLSALLTHWKKKSTEYTSRLSEGEGNIECGLAIGLTASRVVANVLLWRWDKVIRQELTPVHYGRYVDDMFLVLNDGGNITDTRSFMRFVSDRLFINKGVARKKVLEENGDIWSIKFPKNYYQDTKIQFQSSKQKLFLLEGKAGLDLIDNIEKEMAKLSSEHRLMPSIDHLDSSTATKVLSASDNATESADTLRRADGLSIHRLSWSIQLRQVETIARDLHPTSWFKERSDFYRFAQDHILRPDKILNHFDYLPRLLSLSISVGDWAEANKIVDSSFSALDELINKVNEDGKGSIINGVDSQKLTDEGWSNLYKSLIYYYIDCSAKSYVAKENSTDYKVKSLATKFIKHLSEMANFNELFFSRYLSSDFFSLAPKLQRSDLAKLPYKVLQTRLGCLKKIDSSNHRIENQQRLYSELKSSNVIPIYSLIKFLAKTQRQRFQRSTNSPLEYENIIPFLFPTRPYSSAEIVELLPECIGIGTKNKTTPTRQLAKYINVIKGSWVSQHYFEPFDEKITKTSRIKIGNKNNNEILVSISSLGTSDSCWEKSACNKPDLSLKRYKQICDLINRVVSSSPKPDYLFLPELSIPIQWIDSISNRLIGAGINLIAGTEYRHEKNGKQLLSEACLILEDDRLGYKNWTKIWQPKLAPAPDEEQALASKYGKVWKPVKNQVKPIYAHNGFHFGVMICSELQNSRARVDFQGNVDALAVLSWNRDLETFSALVESAALDVHSYIILANNRKYGDSRVRSPAKQSFKRDLARLKGGANDFFVTVRLDIKALREFQSRAKRWSSDNDLFKPVPEGFKISSFRKVQPPK
ncbi:RNA-directed DNA polymerase [Vibrio vulnificus]|uniref:RNA-directed DNA polymerase n=1 Tax=Vibrio vulnificus TaxID=672 RepID=UPI001CDD4E39|nr:RNA-directed DNA polymerase [Vibrio vulnificus]